MKQNNDFKKFYLSNKGNSNTLDRYINGLISPMIVEERRNNVTTTDVFSRLMADRIIFLGTDIDSDVANIITSQLIYLNSIDNKEEISLYINSPGGSIVDGLAIYDVMNYVSPDVKTYAIGLAASMGAVLLSSGTKGKRYALQHSRIMIHQPMGGIAPGTPESDIAIAYEQIRLYKQELYEILAKNTGQNIEAIVADSDRDNWFTATSAQKFGLIDNVLI